MRLLDDDDDCVRSSRFLEDDDEVDGTAEDTAVLEREAVLMVVGAGTTSDDTTPPRDFSSIRGKSRLVLMAVVCLERALIIFLFDPECERKEGMHAWNGVHRLLVASSLTHVSHCAQNTERVRG